MTSGHAVLVVPVPALDAFVRARTARDDASFVSTDPRVVHAHVTVLGPWLGEPTPDDLAAVADVVATEPAFDVVFARVAQFPDGLLHLLPEPAEPFARLTALLAERFPQTPPYAGRYADPVPHLTLDHRLTGASVASVLADLGELVPVRTRAERVDLQWWANHDCHLRQSWRLGSTRPA